MSLMASAFQRLVILAFIYSQPFLAVALSIRNAGDHQLKYLLQSAKQLQRFEFTPTIRHNPVGRREPARVSRTLKEILPASEQGNGFAMQLNSVDACCTEGIRPGCNGRGGSNPPGEEGYYKAHLNGYA